MQVQHHPLLNQTLGTEREVISFHYGSARSGQKVYIQSSLHADELPGMLVSFYLKQKLKALEADHQIAGEIVVVPVANPIGLNQHLMTNFLGRFEFDSSENFNRNYPDVIDVLKTELSGKLGTDPLQNKTLIRTTLKNQLQSQQPENQLQSLRHTLMMLACDADIVLDLHCDWEAVLHVYTADPLWPDVEPLARLLASETSLLAEESGGNPFDEACSQTWYRLADHFGDQYPIPHNGCVAVTVELRGQTEVDHQTAEKDAQAIIDYLIYQGHIQGMSVQLPEIKAEPTPLAGVEPVKTTVSGVVVPRCSIGSLVQAGQPVADIVNPLTDTVTTLYSHVTGILFARHSQRFATAGDVIARIAGPTAYRTGPLLSA